MRILDDSTSLTNDYDSLGFTPPSGGYDPSIPIDPKAKGKF